MTRKLDDVIELLESRSKETYKKELEYEMVMECTPLVTYPEEVEETLGTPIEVEPLDQTQLEDLGLNTCNHDIPLSYREVPSFDESKPQPNPLPNCPSLDVSLGKERGPEPPIKPHSLDSFRMKELDSLTIHTPPSPHVSDIFGEDVDTFTRTFSQNMDTLEQQLTKETILESNCQNAFRVLKTQFEKIFSSMLIKPSSLDESKEQDTSNRSGNDAHADDVDIKPIYDEEPMVEVQTTAEINIFATRQQHTEQPEFNNEVTVSELGIHDHNNELSSSKLVPKVVPPSDKTDTSRQELELLFHHRITMLRSYALSWKPCQGDSLNLPDHRIHKDGDGDASFQLKSDSLPHAHAQSTKTFYKHQDSRIMKAQELKTKTSAQTLIYKIFLQRYQVYQGRLLTSFQDDAKYEHVGQDTRSQGGKDD
ncbi:hypothetical protein Tco_1401854 [Tanacetum coccineum]